MQHLSRWLIAVLLIAGLAGIGYLWWSRQAPVVPIASAPASSASVAAPDTTAPSAQQGASAPANYPIDAIRPEPGASAALPAIADADSAVRDAVIGLLGREQALSFLDLGDFPRRFVATVDNLARGHAASRVWPVVPAPARFLVVEKDGTSTIAGGNADRYNAFVRFATAIDSAGAVALYVRMYPLLQKAYEDLGYPDKYFNNRLVEVIDQLLQTPEPEAPIAVTLTRVKGPIAEQRPWLRYEFADPALEERPAGQKILLRMGLRHTQALKTKLRDLRSRIAGRTIG
ncbi:MAG: DUF3014 domain-containing protein [Burkholderiaceae bacterium]